MHGQCDQERLVWAIRDLLSLYYQPDDSAEMRARQIALFVKDMGEFSDDCAFWAIDEWRKAHDRRPTPAALRQMAMMRKQEAFKAAERLKRAEPEPRFVEPDPEKRAENLERILAATGFIVSHRPKEAK
jgi:hypothetical protein